MKLAIGVYAIAMVLANLIVAKLGSSASPFIAFFLIGLDLVVRDWLHVRLKIWQMGCLIAATGVLTYVLNPAAGQIAVASSVAFTLAALADWLVFAKMRGSWMRRANGSNVAGAAVDSVVFPTVAFGSLMPEIVALQFLAKVAGGAAWSFIIDRFNGRPVNT